MYVGLVEHRAAVCYLCEHGAVLPLELRERARGVHLARKQSRRSLAAAPPRDLRRAVADFRVEAV